MYTFKLQKWSIFQFDADILIYHINQKSFVYPDDRTRDWIEAPVYFPRLLTKDWKKADSRTNTKR